MQDKRFDAFFSGYELEAYRLFGAHKKNKGVEFCVYAPHAKHVDVFTSFDWNKDFHMDKIDERGIFYVYVYNLKPIYSYRYRIYLEDGSYVEKADPYAYCFEKRPANASCIYDLNYFKFKDSSYLKKRVVDYSKPMNIYEIHCNGFKKGENEFASYQDMKKNLIPYLVEQGYNYVEFMPLSEHPFDGSWGYQATGFFSITSRYGSPYDLMDLINELHKNKIGVLLDVVYFHFAIDDYGLRLFDGEPLYEYSDAKRQLSQWGSACFNLGSNPVISFLMSSANFYLKEMHFDGLRFDAVSNFIFINGNKDLGENQEGLSFIKRITHHLKCMNPSCLLIAEDSSDYPNVTKPVMYDGLGFDYKWDLGWMNDTLNYYGIDPIYKKYHHNDLTFSMAYYYSERFLLPLSHDEVVHSKKTIIDKMWGDYNSKFALCRNLFCYMMMHPGKKLNFMGNEIAMFREFDETKELDWFLLKYPIHDAFHHYIQDLNKLYLKHPVLSKYDYIPEYFRWIDADNYEQSIYSFYRYDEDECVVTVLNMLPLSYKNYRIGVPFKGTYYELMNSDNKIYNGSHFINAKPIVASNKKYHYLSYSIKINLAPYAALILKVKVSKEKLKDYFNPKVMTKSLEKAAIETLEK